ncbi:hypothetical protein C2G38_77182 [Gigaspora rosea]|uniref:WD40-repeat-containing domain protein n=1 Tax=Gigaspora rosea TaxID=44941 RepID=A0A397UX28_9GLOM|nr:hypothetical protein C2G38_77182 [Gigaspora rosea]
MSDEDKHLIEIESESRTLYKPHNGKKITDLLISPNIKYAATWSKEDKSIYGWPLDKNQPDYFIDFMEYCKHSNPRLISVSDHKLVAIRSTYERESDEYSIIEVVDLVAKQIINLEMSYLNKPITEYNHVIGLFCNNGDFIVSADQLNYSVKIFKFSFKNLNLSKKSWKITNSIEISGNPIASDVIKEKIIILDSCGSITQWDLNTLLFEKQYQLDWNIVWEIEFTNDYYLFNKNFTLFAACIQVSETNIHIYVYSTENAMLLSQYEPIKKQYLSYADFISYEGGERLLLFFGDDDLEFKDLEIEIRDPYHLEHVIDNKTVSSLCEELSELNEGSLTKLNINEAEFILLEDEKIYCISDCSLQIHNISEKQWIKYLSEKLKDKIDILPFKSQIIRSK